MLEVEGGEGSLEQRCKHVAVLRQARDLAARRAVGLGEQPLPERELARDDRTAGPRDDVRADLGHPPFAEGGKALEQRVRDRQLEDRVAEELQPLV